MNSQERRRLRRRFMQGGKTTHQRLELWIPQGSKSNMKNGTKQDILYSINGSEYTFCKIGEFMDPIYQ